MGWIVILQKHYFGECEIKENERYKISGSSVIENGKNIDNYSSCKIKYKKTNDKIDTIYIDIEIEEDNYISLDFIDEKSAVIFDDEKDLKEQLFELEAKRILTTEELLNLLEKHY
jgi:hypothetical protein